MSSGKPYMGIEASRRRRSYDCVVLGILDARRNVKPHSCYYLTWRNASRISYTGTSRQVCLHPWNTEVTLERDRHVNKRSCTAQAKIFCCHGPLLHIRIPNTKRRNLQKYKRVVKVGCKRLSGAKWRHL